MQIHCYKCNKDLGILPGPVCNDNMICKKCFNDISREGIMMEIEEILKQINPNDEFKEWKTKTEKQETLGLS